MTKMTFKNLTLLLIIVVATSCHSDENMIFMLGNSSPDNKVVHFKVLVDSFDVFNGNVEFLGDQIAFLPVRKKIPYGNCTVKVEIDSGRISTEKQIMADRSRFIFIEYKYNLRDSVNEDIHNGTDTFTIKRPVEPDPRLEIVVTNDTLP